MNTWNISMLVIHLLSLAACLLLIRRAPCWMQQCVQIGLAVGAAFFSLAYYLAYEGSWLSEYAMQAGFGFEHCAVLFMVLRLIFWPKGIQAWNSSSLPYHSL